MLISTDCCHLLKAGVQRLMDDREILFEKNPVPSIYCKDVSIITISANPSGVSTKRPVRITSVLKVTPLIITMPGSIPYSSDKTVPWNYVGDVYYHDVKQDWLADEDQVSEKVDPDVGNIVGTNKLTRSGRLFSPDISPPTARKPVVITPASVPAAIDRKSVV